MDDCAWPCSGLTWKRRYTGCEPVPGRPTYCLLQVRVQVLPCVESGDLDLHPDVHGSECLADLEPGTVGHKYVFDGSRFEKLVLHPLALFSVETPLILKRRSRVVGVRSLPWDPFEDVLKDETHVGVARILGELVKLFRNV